jgi:hypothetical protein
VAKKSPPTPPPRPPQESDEHDRMAQENEDKADANREEESQMQRTPSIKPYADNPYYSPPDAAPVAAHAKGGAVKRYNKGGAVESSKEQVFENNKAEALVYPGPDGLAKGGRVDKQHVKPAKGSGWRRWGK